MIFFRLIKDSIKISLNSLLNNKLRTFLSLAGISIGIFCIISVMATIDSLELSIRNNVSSLGNNTIYIQKWPWSFSSDYPWWKYLNRPVPTIEEAEMIRKKSNFAEYVSFAGSTSKLLEYESKSVENASIIIVEEDYNKIRPLEIEKGRYFSSIESKSCSAVIILGWGLANSLFGNIDPIGKEVKLSGRKLKVIGVIKKEGQSIFDDSMDELAVISASYAKNIINLNSDEINPFIAVKANENHSIDELIDELFIIMKSLRRLKPYEEENFSLNQASMINKGLDNIFNIIDIAGIIIGGFSILVGGFGIANIMFVSVKERTKEIGIQKAIGAKSFLILFQFLTESTVLSFIGGLLGLLLVWILLLIASNFTPLDFILSFKNIFIGSMISIIIGIISGYAPARVAAKLDPVKAMNYV